MPYKLYILYISLFFTIKPKSIKFGRILNVHASHIISKRRWLGQLVGLLYNVTHALNSFLNFTFGRQKIGLSRFARQIFLCIKTQISLIIMLDF